MTRSNYNNDNDYKKIGSREDKKCTQKLGNPPVRRKLFSVVPKQRSSCTGTDKMLQGLELYLNEPVTEHETGVRQCLYELQPLIIGRINQTDKIFYQGSHFIYFVFLLHPVKSNVCSAYLRTYWVPNEIDIYLKCLEKSCFSVKISFCIKYNKVK